MCHCKKITSRKASVRDKVYSNCHPQKEKRVRERNSNNSVCYTNANGNKYVYFNQIFSAIRLNKYYFLSVLFPSLDVSMVSLCVYWIW